jgi:hypothetical protein
MRPVSMRATTGTLRVATLPDALFKGSEPAVHNSFMNGTRGGHALKASYRASIVDQVR